MAAVLLVATTALAAHIGTQGLLYDDKRPSGVVAVAPDENLWDDALDAGIKHDQHASDEAKSQMYYVRARTRFLILAESVRPGRTKVRILDGRYAGRVGWVLSTDVHPAPQKMLDQQ